MNNFNQKGFAPLIVLVIIIAVLAVGGYFVVKSRVAVAPTQSPTPTGTATATTDETANWKTYANTKYGFEFKYPAEWDLKTIDVNVKQSNQSEPLSYFSKYKLAEHYVVFSNNKNARFEFDLVVYNNPTKLSASEFYKKYNDTGYTVTRIRTANGLNFTIGDLGGMSNGVGLITEKDNKIIAIEDIYRSQSTDFYNQFLSTFKFTSSTQSFSNCLPVGIKFDDRVGVNITVEQKLNELKATCNSANKLVDTTEKQITFYHLTGCWGNPPSNYLELLQQQQNEINKLQEQYTVIEMICNPSGIPIP